MTVEERSGALKDAGNERLKAGRFAEAIDLYTEAISLHETAVLYANRSFANAKLESYGLAIADAVGAHSSGVCGSVE